MASRLEHPATSGFTYTTVSLRKAWPLLHAADCEPLPRDKAVAEAWVLFHNGCFAEAATAGMDAGVSGSIVASRSLCAQASHWEADGHRRIQMLQKAAELARHHQVHRPDAPNAWFLEARALGHYSQHISVGLALAEGLGSRVRRALDQTLKLAPKHAEAHLAMAAFHAEVIDKVGVLIGGLTYGANKDVGMHHYRNAMALDPHSVTTLLEYANGLHMLEGERARAEVDDLLARAARAQPLDALQQLELAAALRTTR